MRNSLFLAVGTVTDPSGDTITIFRLLALDTLFTQMR